MDLADEKIIREGHTMTIEIKASQRNKVTTKFIQITRNHGYYMQVLLRAARHFDFLFIGDDNVRRSTHESEISLSWDHFILCL